jgi:hypothetical protein
MKDLAPGNRLLPMADTKKQIIVYSDDSSVRASVISALGKRAAKDLPEGGLGVARQLKDEVFNCPPVLVITGRQEDSWLAAWSMAEASVVHPIDPFTLAKTAAELLRGATPTSA